MDPRFAIEGVGPSTPAGQAAEAIVRARVKPLFKLKSAAVSGTDSDAVHDMRVASRRVREAMKLVAPLFSRKEFAQTYRWVRDITRALGPVRDADVFVETMSRIGRTLPEEGRRATAFFIGLRLGQREAHLVELEAALQNTDSEEQWARFSKLAKSAKRFGLGTQPLSAFAHYSVAERIAAVNRLLPVALVESNIPRQHELRIAVKHLRYAVEVFAPCYAEGFDDIHTVLVSYQDVLGDLHDLHVLLDFVAGEELRESAIRAGCSEEGLDQVASLLRRRAHLTFGQFQALARRRPPAALLLGALMPLERPDPGEKVADPLTRLVRVNGGRGSQTRALQLVKDAPHAPTDPARPAGNAGSGQ
jgi:CHAD domain-containing protein